MKLKNLKINYGKQKSPSIMRSFGNKELKHYFTFNPAKVIISLPLKVTVLWG